MVKLGCKCQESKNYEHASAHPSEKGLKSAHQYAKCALEKIC